MSLASSTILKRTLLTATRSRTIPRVVLLSKAPAYTARTSYQQPLTTTNTPRTFTTTTAKMGVHNLETKAAFDQALSEKGLMVLDCFATWCGPCKAIAPQVVK